LSVSCSVAIARSKVAKSDGNPGLQIRGEQFQYPPVGGDHAVPRRARGRGARRGGARRRGARRRGARRGGARGGGGDGAAGQERVLHGHQLRDRHGRDRGGRRETLYFTFILVSGLKNRFKRSESYF